MRIIGGRWRGRKISFPSLDGLRPTGDRIRETLFNWLGQNLAGQHVVDLFAGSGALGFEALSRGASSVVFVDVASEACRHLSQTIDSLDTDAADTKVSVAQQTAEAFVQSAPKNRTNLLFLDPPFAADMHSRAIELVIGSKILAPNALVYLESPVGTEIDYPAHWQDFRKKTAGTVCYQLLQT